jgi:hypothetical protein
LTPIKETGFKRELIRVRVQARGKRMAEPTYPAGLHDYRDNAEELERLEAAMDETPRGALVLAAISVALLMAGWLGIYFLVFIPRGTVG